MKPVYMNEVLMQLFVFGPTWDGNLVSKSERDDLIDSRLASRVEGWNYLTEKGVTTAVACGMLAKDWHDKRWYDKAACK